jgi:putative flippase GtrA
MAVQLAAVGLIARCVPGHYLVASAVALEITLLHNFVWHVHYTWRERAAAKRWGERLVRFHLSNGVVSLVGNLLMMRWLVQELHLPLLVSNSIAILCCSIVNFFLGDQWVFGTEHGQRRPAS